MCHPLLFLPLKGMSQFLSAFVSAPLTSHKFSLPAFFHHDRLPKCFPFQPAVPPVLSGFQHIPPEIPLRFLFPPCLPPSGISLSFPAWQNAPVLWEAGLRIFGFLSHTFSLMSFKHTPPCIALPFPTLFLLSLLLFFQPFQFPYRFLHQRMIGIIENTGQQFPSPLTRY